MKYIQIQLTDEEYLQFKALSDANLRPVKSHLKALVLELLNKNKENKYGAK